MVRCTYSKGKEEIIVTETVEQIKLGTAHLIDSKDIEELIDVIETVDMPIVGKLYDLGFELEDDMGRVEVRKSGTTVGYYEIYVDNNNDIMVEVTVYDNPLSSQVLEVIKNSTIK